MLKAANLISQTMIDVNISFSESDNDDDDDEDYIPYGKILKSGIQDAFSTKDLIINLKIKLMYFTVNKILSGTKFSFI